MSRLKEQIRLLARLTLTLLITISCLSSEALALIVNRDVLIATPTEYRDLPENVEDSTKVLIAPARPMAQPVFYTKVDVVEPIEEVTVTTGLPRVQAKAYLCDDSQEDCE